MEHFYYTINNIVLQNLIITYVAYGAHLITSKDSNSGRLTWDISFVHYLYKMTPIFIFTKCWEGQWQLTFHWQNI